MNFQHVHLNDGILERSVEHEGYGPAQETRTLPNDATASALIGVLLRLGTPRLPLQM